MTDGDLVLAWQKQYFLGSLEFFQVPKVLTVDPHAGVLLKAFRAFQVNFPQNLVFGVRGRFDQNQQSAQYGQFPRDEKLEDSFHRLLPSLRPIRFYSCRRRLALIRYAATALFSTASTGTNIGPCFLRFAW